MTLFSISAPAERLSRVVSALVACAALLVFVAACDKPQAGSPEAVADAFVDAYFRRADQVGAKQYTALGASRMLDEEIAEVAKVRDEGYNPRDASLDVAVERGERSSRGKRVRFDYTLRFKHSQGEVVKHADVELAQLDGQWKVVRVAVNDHAAPPSAS